MVWRGERGRDRLAALDIPQPCMVSPDDGLGSIGDLQFGEDVGHVVADCLRAQVEVPCNLGVGLVLGDQRENLLLALSELRKGVDWCARR